MSVRHGAKLLLGTGMVSLVLACSGGSSDSTGPKPPPVTQPGSVQGVAKDSTGAGVAGASVSLSATGQTTLSSTTATDGTFSFSQVTPGSWTLTITPPSGYTVSGQSAVSVSVVSSQTAQVSFTLSKPVVQQFGSVQGTVLDSAGAAVSGAGLALSATGRTTLSATSGSDGKYAFAQVPVGGWSLTVTAPTGYTVSGAATVSVAVTAAGATPVNFTLTKPAAAEGGKVTISGFAFSPTPLTIAAGSTVSWTNKDAVAHTATADDGSFDTGDIITNGSSASVSFNKAGTYTYHCAIHPTMKATIIVQ